MRTDWVHEPSIARPTGGADPAVIVGRLGGMGLACAAVISLLPSGIVPNAVPLVLIFACVGGVLIVGFAGRYIRVDAVTPFSLLVVAIGLIYVAASALALLPAGSLRPLRQDFIPRHSYYVFAWIPLIAGTTMLFRAIWSDLVAVARRSALPALLLLAIADFVTAWLLGDPEKIVWEEYTSFLDPSAITFFYAASFFLHVAATRRIRLALAIVTIHGAVSSVSDYGMMYNTMTGAFVLVSMWVFALASLHSARAAYICVVALGTALVLGLAAGAAAPGLLGFDLNSQWRFLVWRENLFASLDSGLVGVGYGTPYYELSSGNIGEAFRLSHFSEFAQHALSSPMDILYVRGQHSSFVNAFYRTGILGGVALIAFNLAVLLVVMRAVGRGSREGALLAAAAGSIFVIEASQIAMHVGIESPRYFAMYALSVGLARAAAPAAGGGRDA